MALTQNPRTVGRSEERLHQDITTRLDELLHSEVIVAGSTSSIWEGTFVLRTNLEQQNENSITEYILCARGGPRIIDKNKVITITPASDHFPPIIYYNAKTLEELK